jgi:hypothetical protein
MILTHQTGVRLHGGEFSSRFCDTAIQFCTNHVATLPAASYLVAAIFGAFALHLLNTVLLTPEVGYDVR